MSTGPLAGIVVVEFAGLAPISVAGMVMSDLGAEVIRIDRRDHNADVHGNLLRRGRRSISIDLKHPSGVDIAKRLIERADVLIEAYRPGVMERLNLGPADARALNEQLIYGRLTGWGQDGPFASAAGHDITYLALTGALHPIGPSDRPPTPPLNYVADMGGGAMFLLVGVLAALHERQRSGHGQVVDAAMVDGVSVLAASMLRGRADGTWRDERGANVIDGGAPFYRTYECSDGRYIAVGAIEAEFYGCFVRGLGLDPAQLPTQMDRAEWPGLAATFAARIRERSRSEWEAEFDGTDACVAPVLTPEEAPHHPQLVARSTFARREGHWHPAPAPKLERTPLSITGDSPRRGADTVEILGELGFSEAEVSKLMASGAAYEEVAG